ncbi:MAG: FG-GAP repeat protein, partial [Thermoplasmata archaeon]|nr:FG-GAP repeat protein [Thermoplasmata archaeon]
MVGGIPIYKKAVILHNIVVTLIFFVLLFNSLFVGLEFKNLSANFDNESDTDSESFHKTNARSSSYIIDLNTGTSYPHHNVTIYGVDSSDNAGYSVTSGDVNGDGRDDIIIGACYADGYGNCITDCGEVYVIYGGNSLNGTIGLNSSADMVIYGADNTDQTGYSLATGDVNGDAISDIIIGAIYADGPAEGRSNCGEVYVIFGGSSLPAIKNLSASLPDVTIYGAGSGDLSGRSVGTGDINGDNINDIIIGATSADGPSDLRTDCGEVYVIFGNTTLLSTIDLASQADVTIYGVDNSDYTGKSVCSGDVDCNGYDDIIIGAYYGDGPGDTRPDSGEVYLIYGNNTLPSPSTIDLAFQADMTVDSSGGALGTSVASGDVNGDNKDDIIMGAPGSNQGVVYIIYGNTSLPLTQDFQNQPSDVKIYGYGPADSAGVSVTAGDTNGDWLDDIVIGAERADGPGNGRWMCGEVYVINGSSTLPPIINLELSPEGILIYGADNQDQAGKSLSVGKINNDNIYDIIIGAPYANGQDNLKPASGEVYLILSSGKILPVLKTEFLRLTNGDGLIKKTCYAKYKPYTFEMKITDNMGFTDIETVTFSLDYNGQNLQYNWLESTKEFTEINDPNDYADLNNTSSARNDGNQSWFIYFNITFNWSYPENKLHGAQVYCTGDSGLYDWLNLSTNVYRVENHLNFNGTINVTGNYQGSLYEGDWIRGGEQLTWEDLKVVYEGTETFFPPKDSGVMVTVWDADGDFWTESSNPGENISITATADNETNLNEIFTINITGVPSNCDNSNITFKLKIDADNITFSDPFPNEEQWQTVINPQCGITLSDPTTKVNASSIQYRISTDNGTTWENEWNDVNVLQEDTKSINCVEKPILKEGRDNLIQWRAKDTLGNGYNESEKYSILIDISNVTFTDPIPSFDEWQTNLSVVCNITIIDNLSGVNASSIDFRFSTGGIYNYGPWQSAREIVDDKIVNCSVNPTFEEGEDNYIQWRAKDKVGNGPFVSEDYQIKIKINYPPEVSLLSPSNGIIIKTLTPKLTWKGTDPDEDTLIYYSIYLSTDETKITNLDQSAVQDSNIIETKYKLESPLNDGFNYYWTVIPN